MYPHPSFYLIKINKNPHQSHATPPLQRLVCPSCRVPALHPRSQIHQSPAPPPTRHHLSPSIGTSPPPAAAAASSAASSIASQRNPPENSMGIPPRLPDHEEEEEYDDALFYEDIQAPKFVDLTAPDAGLPDDDPAWFCLRVGK